jgi:hypothetical protein
MMPLFVFLALGCSGGTLPSKISGKVTKNGTPLKGGSIKFHAKEGGVYSAPIQLDGSYVATDLPAGEMDVTVETESVKKSKLVYGGAQGKAKDKNQMVSKGPPDFEQVKGEYVPIPPRYADKKTSGLSVTLTRGTLEHDFELAEK